MPWLDRFTRTSETLPTNLEPVRMTRVVSDGSERRRDDRAEVEILITAITRDGKRFQAYSRDLSQRGSAVIVWGELAIGEKVSLAFRFPQREEEIVVPAVVRHAIEHRYGLEFVSDDHQQLEAKVNRICRVAAGDRSVSNEN